ncbi:MAG: hypothetical protein ABI686_13340 [Acidobacteriota bacterium]
MDETHNSEYSWTIEYVERQNIVKVVVENDFCANGHTKMIGNIVSQKFWNPGMNLLIDDRKVKFKNTDIELVKKVSEGFRAFGKELGNGKTAILMGSLSDYARGRQFELLTDDKVSTDIEIFMDEEKALSWLIS